MFLQNSHSILVTGGAGYIATPTVLLLVQHGYHVVIIDHKPQTSCVLTSLIERKQVTYIPSDYAHVANLRLICAQYPICACMHFAAYIEVGESVKRPREYYQNNVIKAITCIETLLDAGVENFIFSSSCAVYGIPQVLPLTEDHPRIPISPYGRNKLIVEMVLEDYARAYGLRYVILRYFNACGALPEQNIGERHEPETHLIPRALHAAYTNQPFTIFGNSYPTPDGTCIRDYLHIADLANAHHKALEYLITNKKSLIANLGTGIGYSVHEILTSIERITGCSITRVIAEKREGDPALLIANPARAQSALSWKPQHSELETIIRSAHLFHQANKKQSVDFIKKDDIP
jgi:UDP-glucose 4-epimerase